MNERVLHDLFFFDFENKGEQKGPQMTFINNIYQHLSLIYKQSYFCEFAWILVHHICIVQREFENCLMGKVRWQEVFNKPLAWECQP